MRVVRRLRTLELPLDDIGEVVRLRTSGEAPCQPVRDAFARESDAVDVWPHACVCHVFEGAK